VGIEQNITLNEGQSYTLSVSVGGEHNVYQWYKDAAEITGAQSNTLEITDALLEDAGVYTCQITNTLATELILQSRQITLTITNLPLSITSPNGGEIWQIGSSHDISWMTTRYRS